MSTMDLSFACPSELLVELEARYGEPHRHYHTWRHVLACFAARDALAAPPSPAVDLAILFHDAIYEPLAHDNEAASAALMVGYGARFGLDPAAVARAEPIILATKHADATVIDPETALMLDADLSILGSDPATFATYERAVRKEYAAVDDAAWNAGRAGVLETFLERPVLYATARGRALWDAPARRNLRASLAALRATSRPPSPSP